MDTSSLFARASANSKLFFLPNVVRTLAPAIAASFVYAVFAFNSVKKPTSTPAHKQLTLNTNVPAYSSGFLRQ